MKLLSCPICNCLNYEKIDDHWEAITEYHYKCGTIMDIAFYNELGFKLLKTCNGITHNQYIIYINRKNKINIIIK